VKPLPSQDLEHLLKHTAPLWEEARGQHFFISGGTGFFGAWLLESLAHCNRKLELGLSATVLSRDPAAFAKRMPHLASEPCIRLLQGDVRDFIFPENEFRYVVHAATATSAVAAGEPLELLNSILGGMERMLALAKMRGTRKFLFTSSGAVYGKQPPHISHLPESYLGGPDWLDPNAVYAEGKRVSEQMCALYAKESSIEFKIARCFAFVGPHLPLDQNFAIGNFIRDAMAGKKIEIKGDGTPMRSYLYAADLAIWLWTMLFRAPAMQPFNVGSGHAVSIRELAGQVVAELNPKLEIEITKSPVAGAQPLQYVPDVTAAEQMLGLRETIGLREAIRRTAAWHR